MDLTSVWNGIQAGTVFVRDNLIDKIPLDQNISLAIVSLVLGWILSSRKITLFTIWIMLSVLIFLVLKFV